MKAIIFLVTLISIGSVNAASICQPRWWSETPSDEVPSWVSTLPIDTTCRNGDSFLHVALKAENVPYLSVKNLLKAGADIEARDAARRTPLMTLVKHQSDPSFYNLFISEGAELYVMDYRQNGILHYLAAFQNDIQVFDIMISAFVNLEEKRTIANSALSAGRALGLFNDGVDARNALGQTALNVYTQTSGQNNLDIFNLFVQADADVNAEDHDKVRPIDNIGKFSNN